MSVDVKVDGMEELHQRLKNLTTATRKEGGRFALRKAAGVIKEEAVQNAAKFDDKATPEQIAKNIAVRWNARVNRVSGDLGYRIGVLGGAKRRARERIAKKRRKSKSGLSLEQLGEISGKGKDNPGGDTWYWRFLEFGRAGMRAQPFLRQAMEAAGDRVADEFVRQYNSKLDRMIKTGKI